MSQAGFLLVKVLESCSTGADACLRMEKEMGKRFRTGWWFIVHVWSNSVTARGKLERLGSSTTVSVLYLPEPIYVLPNTKS